MSLLEKIILIKKREITKKKSETSLQVLKNTTKPRKSVFLAQKPKNIQIIAEIKRASPSKGLFAPDLDVKQKINQYQQGGADAISILTDFSFFKGGFNDFSTARGTSSLPLLRKDFIIDEYQLYESLLIEADAVLLIARILEQKQLLQLYHKAIELGLIPVVEVFDIADLEKIASLQNSFIGVNNRNLADFSVSLDNVLRMAEKIDSSNLLLAFSGITSVADVKYLFQRGISSFLIGEFLAKATNAQEQIEEMKQI